MRHQVKGRKLGRTTPHRKATLQALSVALIMEQRIQTTLPKAKELKTFVEPIITKAKEDTTHNRRQVFSKLRDKYAVTELFDTVIPAVGDRPGGYTRVLKLGKRLGDSAQMAVIELVDFNDVKPESAEKKKKRTRRAGKSNKPTDEAEAKTKEKAKSGDKAKAKSDDKKKPKSGDKAKAKSGDKAKPKSGDKAKAKSGDKAKPKSDDKAKAKSGDKAKASKSKKKASKADAKGEETTAKKKNADSGKKGSADKENKS